jgi:hypothetical protein
VVSVVALNASLKRQKARLNLFPPFEVLQKAQGFPETLGFCSSFEDVARAEVY